MADVTVKLFGQYRLDAGWAQREIAADTLGEVFVVLSYVPGLSPARSLIFKNGARVHRLSTRLCSGDEIWLMGATGGG